MSVFSFAYDLSREDFAISNAETGRTIVLPRDKKLTRVIGPVWPQPFFTQLEDGTEVSVHGEWYGNKHVLFHNREQDWFIRMGKSEDFQWLDRKSRYLPTSNIIPNNIRVDFDRITIQLFDFKNQQQAFFSAAIIEHDRNAIDKEYVKLDARTVKAQPMTGACFNIGGARYTHQDETGIKQGLEKMHADFTANAATCQKICETGVALYAETYKRLYKGNPSKGEPLLTVHFMNKDSHHETYAVPDKIVEFAGLPFERDARAVADVSLLAEKDRISLYRVGGGYLIEDVNMHEHFYLIDGLPWLLYAPSDFARIRARDVGGNLHVIDLDNGMYVRTDGHCTHHTGRGGRKREIFRNLVSQLPDLKAARDLVECVYENLTPLGRAELDQNSVPHNYEIPFKPSHAELKQIFAPKPRG